MNATTDSAPIGVFDSGIGGLSILRALRAELPREDLVYVADSSHAPYGERDEAFVSDRARLLTGTLRHRFGIKALVVACNTATAAAIHLLRKEHPDLPIIGVEPALKPAALASRTRRVGVLATRGTLASAKFGALLASLRTQADFVCQPCDGLAGAIEAGDAEQVLRLCTNYLGALGHLGHAQGDIDTIVLGCTHYPLATDALHAGLPAGMQLLDSGAPVARQTHRLLAAANLLGTASTSGRITLHATGQSDALAQAANRWLKLDEQPMALVLADPLQNSVWPARQESNL